MKRISISMAVAALLVTVNVAAAEPAKQYPIDPISGLVMAPGWELVDWQCNACHTSALIPQNRGNRKVWKETIQWMVDTQGLWDLSDTWEPVLDYLSTYYDEDGVDMKIFRRKFLTPDQMPPMPEESE